MADAKQVDGKDKTEVPSEQVLPPSKKMKVDNDKVSDKNGHQKAENSDGEVQFTSFKDFEVVRILHSNEENKSVSFEAKLRGKEGTAVVMIQKLPFNAEKLQEIITEETELQNIFENDIYHNKKALIPRELNDVKATIVYPAEEKHILRFEKQPSSLIEETPQLYREVTKPFIDSGSFDKQWIYNILEHKQEADRIVFEDSDPEVGFILVPDLKWTGEQMEDLYLQAIVHRRDISCIRDLRGEHIPLLRNLLDNGAAAIKDKYGLPAHKLRIYFHYQPSYYHLHVHYTALAFDAPGSREGKAHLVSSVISNLEICSEYYEKATLPFTLKDNHPLRAKFEEKGAFKKES